jgi:hypothetical protein
VFEETPKGSASNFDGELSNPNDLEDPDTR